MDNAFLHERRPMFTVFVTHFAKELFIGLWSKIIVAEQLVKME